MNLSQMKTSLFALVGLFALGAPMTSQAGLIIGNGTVVDVGGSILVLGGTLSLLTSGGTVCTTEYVWITRIDRFGRVIRMQVPRTRCGDTTYDANLFKAGLIAAGGGLAILVLDESQAVSSIQSSLKEKYSFIDDAEVISDLAALVATTASQVDASKGVVEVKLGEQAARIVQDSSLTAEQQAAIVKDFN